MTDQLAYFFSGSVAEKLQREQAFYERHKALIAGDAALGKALERLRTRIQRLDEHMGAMGMGLLCAQCASQPKGGCCSAFMAGNVDVPQLLINRLLGVVARQVNQDVLSCCFLSQTGCIFPAKPVFCLNYNCTRILVGAEDKAMRDLTIYSGGALQEQLACEERFFVLWRQEREMGEKAGKME